MSETITTRIVAEVLASNISATLSETVDNVLKGTGTISAGIAGTAGEAGVMTLATGHGLTLSDVVMCKWSTGRRYNCTISLVNGDAVTLATGAGDTLPTAGAVVVSKQLEIDAAVTGANVEFIMLQTDVAATFTLEDAGGVELARNIAAGAFYLWTYSSGDTNPITGDDIIKCHVYNAGTTAGNAVIIIGYINA